MAKEFLKLDGPEVVCHYTYDSNLETIEDFRKQLTNSDENIFAEYSPFDDWAIVVSSATHDSREVSDKIEWIKKRLNLTAR